MQIPIAPGLLLVACCATAHAQDLERLRTVVPPVPFGTGRAVVDWDGDGDPDWIVGVDGAAVWLLENEGLRFVERRLGSAGTGLLAVADLDGDGLLDVLHGSSEPAVLLLGQPGGTVRQGSPPSLGQLHPDLDLADVDGDGDLDLLFSGNASASDLLALNDGSASFGKASAALPDASGSQGAVFLDHEGDGDVDIHRRLQFATSEFRLNDGTGTFSGGPTVNLNVASVLYRRGPREALDLDRDGDLDIDYSDVYLENRGGGSFVLTQKPGVGPERWLLDFDGDGRLDTLSNGLFSFFFSSYDFGLFLMRGTATGFVPYSDPTLESIPFAVDEADARDWDGDGDDDVFLPYPEAILEPGGGPLFQPLFWSHGERGFEHPDSFPEDTPYTQLVPADVDGDGDPDLVATAFGARSIDWLENDGTGSVWSLRTVFSGPFSSPGMQELAVLDLERDGDPDVVGVFSNALFLRRNDGAGSWTDATAALPPHPQGGLRDLLAADLTGDGFDDVLELQSMQNLLLRNDGSGVFVDASASAGLPQQLREVEEGDVDLDGDLDLVALREDSPAAYRYLAYLNDGTGRFTPVGPKLPHAGGPVIHGVADLDLDGSADLLVTNTRIDLHAVDGVDGIALTPVSSLPLSTTSSAPVPLFADLTGDGLPEIHLSNGDLWRNLGGFAFLDVSGELPLAPPATYGRPAAAVDLDLDGDLDLLRGGQLQIAWNVARQLALRLWPRVGRPLVLDAYGAPGALFGVWASLSGASPTTNVGATFRLDLSDVVFVGYDTLDGAGRGALTIPVPESLAVVGQAIDFQAVIGVPYRWSNVEPVVLTPR